jgi:hypothetical protein
MIPNSAMWARKPLRQHGALAHQQFAPAMQDQHALLLFALHRHETHGRPRHRFADRLGIGRVVLASLKVGLDITRRHQPDLMTERHQLAGPMVRSGAGLDADQAWCKVGEELREFRPSQLLANDNRAGAIDAVDLKYSLRNIQTNRGNLHSGRLLSLWRSQRPRFGTLMPESRGRPPHHLHRPWRATSEYAIGAKRRRCPMQAVRLSPQTARHTVSVNAMTERN